MSINVSKRGIGINFNERNEAEVVVWAPLADKAEVILVNKENKRLLLDKQEYGYWKTQTDEIKSGDLYKISLNNGKAYPDPASLSQPRGVHEASAVFNLKSFSWTDSEWKNIPLSDYIMYELHAGTYSSQHNFKGIVEKIGYLKELGITAIEIMPVGQFPGSRNWGYDAVFPFAVQNSYGGPEGLQELVNACHENDIAVILDVIYNHIGPEGNYLPQFGPYFTEKYKTPWGQALNYDDAWSDGVREYVIENVLMWFRDFHIDALRMDAVHAIKDLGPTHLIKAIREKVNELTTITGKPYYLVAEIDLNDPVFIDPIEKRGYGANAQWIDEFHHALRVSSGQKPEGYYSDFNGIGHLAKSYKDAYVYDGQFSLHRKKFFGVKTNNPGHQFVVFSQNHDQVGNRMLGERTSQLVSFEMCKLMAGAVMFSPYLPMLFMGEEWAETNPFLFFIDHTDQELAALTTKGRKEEFASFGWQQEPPDPRLEETFNNSMLQWDLLTKHPHQSMLMYYKRLIALRKLHPALHSTNRDETSVEVNTEDQTLVLHRRSSKQYIICAMNFSRLRREVNIDTENLEKILDSSFVEWNGPNRSNDTISNQLIIEPESIALYLSNEHK